MRELRVVPSGGGMLDALRGALAGGAAILPVPGGVRREIPGKVPGEIPGEVERRVALVVETSGSTGRPKRVALSGDALLASAAASESALGGPAQWVLALPTHYIAGINVLARSLAAGTVPVTVEGGHFTADAFLAATARMTAPERCTALVPAQLATLLDEPVARQALAGFRAVLVGGQATPRALLDRARDHGVPVVRSYGSTETSGGCVYDGSPLAATVVKIVGDEVWIGGPTLAEGYLGDDPLTEERFVVDDGVRWFRTADTGSFADDMLSITGRSDDVLISGGVKVALGSVERVLREQPGFADAVVVSGPDPRWGEVPIAFTASGADPTAASAAVRDRLGPAAGPRILAIDAIPLLPSGKPDRAALRMLAAG